MYERPRVSVKIEGSSTFTFPRDLPYICLYFIYKRSHGKNTRQWKSTLSRTDVCPFMKEKICPENY